MGDVVGVEDFECESEVVAFEAGNLTDEHFARGEEFGDGEVEEVDPGEPAIDCARSHAAPVGEGFLDFGVRCFVESIAAELGHGGDSNASRADYAIACEAQEAAGVIVASRKVARA